MIIKLISEMCGAHVHSRMFVGEQRGSLAFVGKLVFRQPEWKLFHETLTLGGLGGPEHVEVILELEGCRSKSVERRVAAQSSISEKEMLVGHISMAGLDEFHSAALADAAEKELMSIVQDCSSEVDGTSPEGKATLLAAQSSVDKDYYDALARVQRLPNPALRDMDAQIDKEFFEALEKDK